LTSYLKKLFKLPFHKIIETYDLLLQQFIQYNPKV
jgi:hypothetical protein